MIIKTYRQQKMAHKMVEGDHLNPRKELSGKRPRRMSDLAVLPLFHKLEGRRVVVIGGGEAAAWKAELLVAAGGRIDLYASEICAEMQEIIAEADGRIRWYERPWGTDIFAHAALAIAELDSDGEAQAFWCAARAAGVPVNVIDNPKFCEFQFGGIVNRSPAVVAISTAGAAPILGQAIRRRIETLIPPFIADRAAIARKLRPEVNSALPMGALRRNFWERFSLKAFNAPPEADHGTRELFEAIAQQDQSGGRVTLVGAGPGDAELLTLGAVRALQSADVILFDDLASEEVLELARREAKRMLVGKRGGRESCRQEDINDMMVRLAKQGKHVVRLKSGDPVIFGRAGEEIARLEEENIPVRLIPGITSASAMAAQLGVSLTHRDHAQSVRFVTGHSRKGQLPDDVDWSGIADSHCTTIFYMGARTAPLISERLMAHGLDGSTPAVVMAAITRHNERRWVGTLAQLEAGVDVVGRDDPVLIGVGQALGETKFAKTDQGLDQATHNSMAL
jgi:uroporphyrin-III C-methyltransferase/precorrin-2 dehydrogenase/sirohydrochlorin ferrochelatase